MEQKVIKKEDMSQEYVDHYVVERSAPKWLATALSSVGAVLAASLLLWIASSQLEISTTQAVILTQLEAQQKELTKAISQQEEQLKTVKNLMEVTNETYQKQIDNLLENQNRIWPRLRVHGENIEALARVLEDMCNCEVRLREPERF